MNSGEGGRRLCAPAEVYSFVKICWDNGVSSEDLEKFSDAVPILQKKPTVLPNIESISQLLGSKEQAKIFHAVRPEAFVQILKRIIQVAFRTNSY